jgi:hypothetical protein
MNMIVAGKLGSDAGSVSIRKELWSESIGECLKHWSIYYEARMARSPKCLDASGLFGIRGFGTRSISAQRVSDLSGLFWFHRGSTNGIIVVGALSAYSAQ